ncbi:MAG TPA: AIR synthase-related protein, partial [Solirubrobacteraceae bacterium]|nr:AIR synthase-related protein [Solirubrobacteraceae bacterium]
GASVLASAELGEGDEAKRPSVQIGDPFAEKKLLECCLELLDEELLVSLQDLGAAGLTSSSSEMAAKGEVGLDIDCSLVPLREADMEPFEIMVSESQERMLCVVEPDQLAAVIAVCEHWETLATPIGTVTDTGRMRVRAGDDVVVDLPVEILVDDCPLYDLEPAPPAQPLYPAPTASLTVESGPEATLLALLGSPNVASRRPVFEQYDPVVQSRTVRRPDDADAAVLALPTGEAIAVSIDGNGRRVACDPRAGAIEAVYECAANLACVGATPLGLTNCLNFGNPEKPHVAWQLVQAVEGIRAACLALEVPVVGGNVSLYNEAPAGPIFPTPVIGMVGRLPDPERAGRLGFVNDGDAIAVVGAFQPSRAGSEQAKLSGEAPTGPLPELDLAGARTAHDTVRAMVNTGAVRSAHDIAEGGFAVALAECCIAGGIGATVSAPEGADLFSEAPGRAFIVSGPEAALRGLTILGHVGGSSLTLEGVLDVELARLAEARDGGLARFM